MTKEELLESIATLKTNAEVTLLEVAKAMGLSEQVVSEKHEKALAVMDEFAKLNIENPIEDFKVIQKQIADNAKAVFDARMTEEFGADKSQNGSDNLLKIYAKSQLKDVQVDEFDEKIKQIKEDDPIAKALASDAADFTSDVNTIAVVEQKNKKPVTSSKRKVDKV